MCFKFIAQLQLHEYIMNVISTVLSIKTNILHNINIQCMSFIQFILKSNIL